MPAGVQDEPHEEVHGVVEGLELVIRTVGQDKLFRSVVKFRVCHSIITDIKQPQLESELNCYNTCYCLG